MIETIYNKWRKQVLLAPYADSLPLFQKKNIFINMIDALFSDGDEMYYLMPELIDFVERNNLNYIHFLDSLFLLRDQVVSQTNEFATNKGSADHALQNLQELIIKIGSYFNHLRTDLNITRRNINHFLSDRVEANILQLDHNLKIEKANSEILTYFGYEKSEIIGKPINNLFSPSSQALIDNTIQQLQNNLRLKIDLEVEAQKKGGQRFQVLLKIARQNINQTPARYSLYIQDNSYIHETKSMLNLLSMALENIGEGILILEPNLSGSILYMNKAMEKMSGFNRQQLLGKPIVRLHGKEKADDLEKAILAASLSSGWEGEVTNIHKKGHPYTISLHTRPVKDEYENIVAIVGIERDITQQKERESRIIHLQKFVEGIINNLPQFVFVTDPDLSIRFWNQSLENELGIPAAEVIGRPVLEVLPELKKFHLSLAIKNVLKTGDIFTKKFMADFSDTSERYYQLYITPIHAEHGMHLLWTILDITKEELLKIHITWQNARLKFLENISQLLNTNLDVKSIFQKFTRELKEIFPFKTLSFLLPSNPEKQLFKLFFLSEDNSITFPQNQTLDLSREPVLRQVIETGKLQVYDEAAGNDSGSLKSSGMEWLGDGGQVVHLPIIFEKEILGILNIGQEEETSYKQSDLDFLQQITSHLAIALKNSFYFNMIELQNKKLFIINSIFNVPQNSDYISQIYEHALVGLFELLDCKTGCFYRSQDGTRWEKLIEAKLPDIHPDNLELAVGDLPGKTVFWDKSQAAFLHWDTQNDAPDDLTALFSWELSSSFGYLAFLSSRNNILDQVNQDFISSLVQDIIKQMIIALDHIHLFEKVKRSESEWKTTFDTVTIGLAVVDEKFEIVRTNKAFNELFNYPPDGAVGKTCEEAFCINSGSKDCCMIKMDLLENTTMEREYLDSRINKRLRRIFYPIWSPQNEFKGGVISIYNVTELRLQEAKIQFLSRFPETNPNLVISIDREKEIIYINPAARKLMEELEISEDEIEHILPTDLGAIMQSFNGRNPAHLEMDHRFRDRVFQYIIYRTSDDNYFYFYGTDITERVDLQRQLLQTERIRAVGEMAAGVAHDFNNLLATILGRTQLLLHKNENVGSAEELKVIEKAAIDGGQIVRRMQEVTREKRDRNYQPLDVNELIKESIIFTANKLKISTQLKDKKVLLHTDFKGPAVVKGDAVELKEVFTNLLLNAYDAMPNGGDLFIESGKSDLDNLQIKFRDTGIGMSESVRNKIFNPFFTTKGEKGTGLGLSIAYKTITAHGGHTRVDSEVNRGTVFTITLPLCDEPLQPKKNREVDMQSKYGEIHLLIVDDEAELLDTMAEILRLRFKSVEIASSGEVALQKIEKSKYDVILTDLGMPEMSGWELARRAKENLPSSHVILVTGWGEQAREELKHHPYVDEILSKPYELNDLIGKINKFFNNHK